MNTNQHAQLQSRAAAVADRMMASATQAMPLVLAAARQFLLPLGAERIRVEVAAGASNTVDGSVSFRLSASTAQGELEWVMPVVMDRGVPILTEQAIQQEFKKAMEVKSAAALDLGERDVATMAVDFKKVSAARAGDLVVYTSPELPRWNLPVSASTLKTEEGRTQVLADLRQSIDFYCLSDFGVTAKIGEAKLPVVRAQDVKAAAQPKALPEVDVTIPEALQEPEAIFGARTQRSAQSFSPTELRASEYRYGFEARVRKISEPVLKAWAQSQGGGAIEVIAWNLDEAKDGGVGAGQGKVVATLRFYTDSSREEVEVSASFNAAGDIDPLSIAKTEQQLKFEAANTAEFKVKSEEEAKQELARFTAQQEQQASAEAFVRANLGLEASDENVALGQNFLSKPAVKSIPILKALLPKEAMTAGKELEIDGNVYVLAESNYGNISGDPVHSAYMLAVLTDKLPNGKRPGLGMFGALGTALSAGR